MANKFTIFRDEQQELHSQNNLIGKSHLEPATPARPTKVIDEGSAKREPLGLRQAASHVQSALQSTVQKQPASSGTLSGAGLGFNRQTNFNLNTSNLSIKTAKTTISNNINKQDGDQDNDNDNEGDDDEQENDISIASLGSDYMPSILEDNQYNDQDYDVDNDHSFQSDEDLLSNNLFYRPFDEELYQKVLNLELADDGLPKFDSDEPFDF